ncbi:MAG: energy transducer TonB [Crocinitomicaceae bacterium]
MKSALLIVVVLLAGVTLAQELVPPPPPPSPNEEVVKSDVVDFPDVEAEFLGGQEALQKYIQDNVLYPEVSRQLGDQGRVYVRFIVEPDGHISKIDVVRGISPELDREAKRLVRGMPRWKAAEVDNKKVRARCILPISFVLEGPKEIDKK